MLACVTLARVRARAPVCACTCTGFFYTGGPRALTQNVVNFGSRDSGACPGARPSDTTCTGSQDLHKSSRPLGVDLRTLLVLALGDTAGCNDLSPMVYGQGSQHKGPLRAVPSSHPTVHFLLGPLKGMGAGSAEMPHDLTKTTREGWHPGKPMSWKGLHRGDTLCIRMLFYAGIRCRSIRPRTPHSHLPHGA